VSILPDDSTKFTVWPALAKDDEGLLEDLFALLTERVPTEVSAYGRDSKISIEIEKLPVGLRAMAATHWLDISMTLDSVCWHFRNFGEPALVDLTEKGLRELGLESLADVFREAGAVMMPLANSGAATWDEAVEKAGLEARVDEIDRRGWDVYEDAKTANTSAGKIYGAWIQYCRRYPDRVFE